WGDDMILIGNSRFAVMWRTTGREPGNHVGSGGKPATRTGVVVGSPGTGFRPRPPVGGAVPAPTNGRHRGESGREGGDSRRYAGRQALPAGTNDSYGRGWFLRW